MGRFEDLRKAKETALNKLTDGEVGKLVGDAVVGTSKLIEGADSVAQRSGLTNRAGKISKFKVAKAAMRPKETARVVLKATAEEIQAQRVVTEHDSGPVD